MTGVQTCALPILAAILFPVFAKAREKARQTACSSNLKQIMLGVQQYAQDYDERLLGYFDYDVAKTVYALQPYVKSEDIFVCPSVNRKPWHRCTASDTWYMSTYAPFFWRTGASLASIQAPADKLFFTELSRQCGVYLSHYPESNTALDGGNDAVLEVHNEGCNNAFYDGHVKWMKKVKVVDPVMWDNP